MTTKDLTVREESEPMTLVRLALTEKVPVEVLERIAALEERVSARNARVSFFQALAAFQAEVGPVPKTAAIAVTRGGATEVRSRYAPLDKIVEHVRPLLQKHGFIFNWNSTVRENGNVCITCNLRHVDGHTETADFEFPQKDASAPGMNGVQVAGSARTYGERYSLIQVLGLTTADPDDDGEAAELPGATISEEQFAALMALADEVKADKAGFCKYLGVASIREIPARRFNEAKAALEQKKPRK